MRTGDWRRLLEPHECPAEAHGGVPRVIWLRENRSLHTFIPFHFRPLPAIKIPLRLDEPPCELPLQSLIDLAFVNGRYDRTLDYRQPCDPPLEPDEAAWADELLGRQDGGKGLLSEP